MVFWLVREIPRGLKNAISRLLANPDMGRRLGTHAHDWVKQHYTAAAMA